MTRRGPSLGRPRSSSSQRGLNYWRDLDWILLIAALGLPTITATTQAATGVRGAVRFTAGDHGSLLSPTASAAATVEMQGQMASLIVSAGQAVQVTNTSVIRTQ